MRVKIETERLILRNLIQEDYEAVFQWCGDPVVNIYMIYPLYSCKEDVKTWIASLNPDDPNNYDLGFELKETHELIGCGGLLYKEKEQVWILGYNLKRDQWGHGYVVEAMKGIMDEIQKTREINVLEGTFAVENYKSQRIMEKLGMTYDRDSEYEKLGGSKIFRAKVFRKEIWNTGLEQE